MEHTIENKKTGTEKIAESALKLGDKIEGLYEKIVGMKAGQHEHWTISHENGFQPVHTIEVGLSNGENQVFSFLEKIEMEESSAQIDEEPPIMVIIEKKTKNGASTKQASLLSRKSADEFGTKIRSIEVEEKNETYIFSEAETGEIHLECRHKNGNTLMKGPATYEKAVKDVEHLLENLEPKKTEEKLKPVKTLERKHEQVRNEIRDVLTTSPEEASTEAAETPDNEEIIEQDLAFLDKLVRKNKAKPQDVTDMATRISQLAHQKDRDYLMAKLLRTVRISHNSAIKALEEGLNDAMFAPEIDESDLQHSLHE